MGGGDENLSHLNDVWESTDGVNWKNIVQNAPWSKRAMFSSTIFNNEIYLIGGGIYNTNYVYNVEYNFNDVWKSSDAVKWVQVTPNANFSPRRFHNSFVMNNKLCIGSGFCLDRRIFPNSIHGLLILS